MHAMILYDDTRSEAALDPVETALRATLEAAGWSVETQRLSGMTIRPCRGCFACWTRTPGECTTDDDGRTFNRAHARSQAIFVLTPMSFGGYSGRTKTALDRMVPNLFPTFTLRQGEIHHPLRYPPLRAWVNIGWQPAADADCAATFATLGTRNGLNGDVRHCDTLVMTDADDDTARTAALTALVQKLEAL